MVFLDGCLDSTLEPLSVRFEVRTVELIVDLEGHIGEEWRLSSAQIIASVAIQDFVIVLNLKDEVVHHAFGHGHLTVDKKAKADEVRVPIIQLD